MKLLIPLCVFGAGTLTGVAVLPRCIRLWHRVSRAYEEQRSAGESTRDWLSTLAPVLQVIGAYHRNTRLRRYKEWLSTLLGRAGAPVRIHAEEFMAGCDLAAVLTLGLALLLIKGLLELPVFLCLLCATGGYFVPVLLVRSYIETRRTAMHRQLPYMIDLVVMTMEAGALFSEAVRRYCEDHRQEALAGEWQIFLNEVERLGTPRRIAFQNLSQRVDTDDMRSLAATVVQGEKFGTSLAVLLRTYAGSLRLKRSQRAEKLAGEAAVRILGPSILMMVAVMLLFLGPILIRYVRNGIML